MNKLTNKYTDKYTDKQIIFFGSLLGYVVTATVMVIVMGFQPQAFKLAGVLFLPFALSSYLICPWLAPKITAADSLYKSILISILAAILTSSLTGALTGLMSVISDSLKRTGSPSFSTNIAMVAIFIGAGLLYSLPGIFIIGTVLGKFIYQRNHK
jgi:hypothetical protein